MEITSFLPPLVAHPMWTALLARMLFLWAFSGLPLLPTFIEYWHFTINNTTTRLVMHLFHSKYYQDGFFSRKLNNHNTQHFAFQAGETTAWGWVHNSTNSSVSQGGWQGWTLNPHWTQTTQWCFRRSRDDCRGGYRGFQQMDFGWMNWQSLPHQGHTLSTA